MTFLSSLDALHGRYDAVFCDVWGVVHNGREAFAPALGALQRYRKAGGVVILLTNVPKPNDPIPGQLDRLRVPRDAWDAIVTSGDAIRIELKKRAPGPMHKIGPPHDSALWANLGLGFADLGEAAFIGISGLNHDERETPEDYHALLDAARARDLELICANPDIVVRVGDKLIWCAGAIARDYAARGGRVVMAGKPHPPIYDLAFAKLAEIANKTIPRGRVLCIGDGVGTDLKGANAQGLDALFIASGMHGEALFTNGALDAQKVEAALRSEDAHAAYCAPALM